MIMIYDEIFNMLNNFFKYIIKYLVFYLPSIEEKKSSTTK